MKLNRIKTPAILLGMALGVTLISGCATMSDPYKQTELVQQYANVPGIPSKPDGIKHVTYWVRQPEVKVQASEETGDPFAIEPATMTDIITRAGIFQKAHEPYIAAVLSKVSGEMKREEIVYFATDNVSDGAFGFVKDKEWGPTVSLMGTVKPISGGSIVAAALFGVLNADAEALGFRFNKQGQVVSAQHNTVSIGKFGNYGYVTEGRKISEEETAKIQDGASTEEVVKTKFGVPEEIKTLKDGSIVWVYSYKKTGRSIGMMFVPGANLFSKNKLRESQVFEVRYKDGIVLNHGYVDMMK